MEYNFFHGPQGPVFKSESNIQFYNLSNYLLDFCAAKINKRTVPNKLAQVRFFQENE